MTGGTSLAALLLRMLVSLGVVTGLLLLAKRFLTGSKGGSPRRRTAGALEVVARQQVGRNQSVTVVRACGRTLVLGVSNERIALLASGDEPLTAETAELEPVSPAPAAPGWGPMLEALRAKTVRRT